MRFLHQQHDEQLELSLDDVFLVPGYFDVGSRATVDLAPIDFMGGSLPIVSANMNAVTGKRMAETMARYGGLGVLPQDMAISTIERIVHHIKQADIRFDTPLIVTPDAPLRDVQSIIRKRAHDMVIVVDEKQRPQGIITHADLRDQDQYTPAYKLMSHRMVTIHVETTNRDAFQLIEAERVQAAPVVDHDGRLVGVLTRDDAVRLEVLKPSLDSGGRLMVGAAVALSADVVPHMNKLLKIGIDAVVFDTAHGHQRQMLDTLKAAKQLIGDRLPIIAGNVCTAEATCALLEAGADVVKVNVGPGSMCTTRMQTGVGRPTFSAVHRCATAAQRYGKHVWADGGVRFPRDVALYLAAGASRVMVGTLLAGTFESPGDIKEDRDGNLYKENFGMASSRAVHNRTAMLDAFDRAQKALFREGISSSKIYLHQDRSSVGDHLINIVTGVQSAFTYVGATEPKAFSEKAVVGVQSTAGFAEGKALGDISH
jgi:IMP dehydrogenase